MVGHPTDMCPTLQEEEVNSIGGGQGQQRRYDPFSQTYNSGWRDHLNRRYATTISTATSKSASFQAQSGSMSLEDIVKAMANNTLHLQQETRSGLKNLENQVSQLANTVGKLQAQNPNKLPSQPERNPKENVSAISLRSGKQLEVLAKKTEGLAAHQEEQEIIVPEQDKKPTKVRDVVSPNTDQFTSSVPFPSRLSSKNKKREQEKEKETLDIFRKVEVNIPLLEAIRQVPRYAKFLKELCTNKRRLSGDEKFSVSENVSAVLQRKVPPKCKDPGIFTIPCKIGNTRYDKCMLDLGAFINVMPLYIYKALNLGTLKDTRVIIQLADRSNTYPVGVVEDVLVQVNELVFPANFYVLDMPNDESPSSAPILLGRPFLKTSRTKIDVHSGVLTMEFDGEVIRFNLFDAMRYPSYCESVSSIDVIDALTEQVFFLSGHDRLDVVLTAPMEKEKYTDLQEHFELKREAPEVELKPLPDHLKYAFFGENDTLPVIIASNLTPNQEQKLVHVLKEHKIALGWTVANIKGISPSMCQHRILLEEGAKPVRQVQRRLNPPMMEVVKKEVMKLLEVGVIYRISDIPWVPINLEDQEKTTFTCPYDTFAYRRMPFGLCNAPATFQRCMDVEFHFDEASKQAFDKLKDKLVTAPVLQPPNWELPFELMCDASNYAVGAMLGLRVGKVPYAIYYASRTLDAAQANYTTTEKELLAVVFALNKFRSYLLGTKIVVFTDHAALKYLWSKDVSKPRLIRWILLLQQFNVEIKDKKGSDNSVTDHLSRLVIEADEGKVPINEEFPDEQLHALNSRTPWFDDLVNFLVSGKFLASYTKAQKD
ncbi:uncharacterized protein LOC110717300 [Chenopodium quinoa]|uniref:uncharacterized protein LOC110717300 n=1 Tax=Chenopodium quinoa TaxID=63459 RepID=UPI000B778372|nr:uncharacterized protein LOC110717300 [Chenopodium quinoa]